MTMTLLNVCTLESLYKCLVLSICLSLVGIKGAFAAQSDRGAQIQISPRLCISSQEAPECKLTLTIKWQVNSAEAVCVLSDYPSLPKYCPESNQSNTLSLDVVASKDIQFMLVNRQTNQPLGGVKFKVMPTSEPKARRRYRNPWSLF